MSIFLGIIIVATGLLALYWIFYGQRKYNEIFAPKKEVELKAVLFDLDGVLIDSFDAWHNVFNDLRKNIDLKPISKEEFKKAAWGGFATKKSRKYLNYKEITDFKEEYSKSAEKHIKNVKLMPGAREIIQKVKDKKLKVGLVTNTLRAQADEILDRLEIKSSFDSIVAGGDAAGLKPYPDPVIKLCQNLGVEPQEAILVGDTQNDYKAGKSAGCVVVGFNMKGDLMISTLEDLEQLL